jgi:hypothetical protein
MYKLYGSHEEFRTTLRWGSVNGKESLVKDLTNEHLVNIINWIMLRPDSYQPSLCFMFEQEAIYRKLEAFSQNQAIPVKCADGSWATMLDGIETNRATDLSITPGYMKITQQVR